MTEATYGHVAHVTCVTALHKLYRATCHAAAGTLTSPKNLYDNATMGTINKVGSFLPATQGEVQDIDAKVQGIDGKVQNQSTEFKQYKNETTTVINILVGKLNSLTLVGNI